MKCFGLTDKGIVRKDNQDCFIIEKSDSENCLILALCDGMGGARAGEVASQLANKAFVSHIYGRLTSRVKKSLNYETLLKDACGDANTVSFEYSRFDKAFSGMGTTLVGGIVKYDGTAYIINVGDSRAYLITHRRRRIRQITTDHSLVQELLDNGSITPEQALTHPQKNVITRAVGSDAYVEGDFFQFFMKAGDILFLCSDGLSNTLKDSEILAFAREHPEPEDFCAALMSRALERGAKDNVTVVAVLK